MLDVAGMATITQRLGETLNDTQLGFDGPQKQHPPVAGDGTAGEIGLDFFARNACKGHDRLRILLHSSFLCVVVV